MELIEGTASLAPALPVRRGTWRLRPGEVPSWIDLPLDHKTASAWRASARKAGLGVDGWLAVLVEYELVRSNLAKLGLDARAMVGKASEVMEVDRLAPTADLRQWIAQLGEPGSQGELPADELPSVVLPERLLAQLAPSAVVEILRAAATSEAVAEAVLMEQAAAAVGLTMEAWVYRTSLGLQAAETA